MYLVNLLLRKPQPLLTSVWLSHNNINYLERISLNLHNTPVSVVLHFPHSNVCHYVIYGKRCYSLIRYIAINIHRLDFKAKQKDFQETNYGQFQHDMQEKACNLLLNNRQISENGQYKFFASHLYWQVTPPRIHQKNLLANK